MRDVVKYAVVTYNRSRLWESRRVCTLLCVTSQGVNIFDAKGTPLSLIQHNFMVVSSRQFLNPGVTSLWFATPLLLRSMIQIDINSNSKQVAFNFVTLKR